MSGARAEMTGKLAWGALHRSAYMWPLQVAGASSQHGGPGVTRFLTWRVRAPRESVLVSPFLPALGAPESHFHPLLQVRAVTDASRIKGREARPSGDRVSKHLRSCCKAATGPSCLKHLPRHQKQGGDGWEDEKILWPQKAMIILKSF